MKHRSMTVLRAGMLLLSAALFGALVWLLWQTVPWAAVRWGILGPVSYTHLDVYKRQHPDRRVVLKAGEEVSLNHGEFSMLLLLASAPGQVFSKDQLYDAAWHEEYRYGTTAVENIIWRLRQKLEDDPRHPVYIKTVIRSGYKIEKPR